MTESSTATSNGASEPGPLCASSSVRDRWPRAWEPCDDRRDGLLKVELVRPPIVRNPREPFPSPEQLSGFRVDHVHDHGARPVLGRFCRADRPPQTPAAPPARPPSVAVVPAHDVELVLGGRVVRDREIRTAVSDGIAPACESLKQRGAQGAVRTRVRAHRIIRPLASPHVPRRRQDAEGVEAADAPIGTDRRVDLTHRGTRYEREDNGRCEYGRRLHPCSSNDPAATDAVETIQRAHRMAGTRGHNTSSAASAAAPARSDRSSRRPNTQRAHTPATTARGRLSTAHFGQGG